MTLQFIETHCHLDFGEFDENRLQLLQQAAAAGINKIIVPGVTLEQSKSLLHFDDFQDLLTPKIHLAFGLHPYFMEQHENTHMAELAALAFKHRDKIVAIGECGIDKSIADIETQMSLFKQHIELANRLGLPLIVHHRQTHHLIAQAFKQIKPECAGVIHAFSGSLQQAQYYIKQGFKLGVGGVITYPRAQKTRHTISQLPLDSLLLETDAPSMPISGKQGCVNTPLSLIAIFDQLVQLRPESEALIAKQLYQSSLDIFRI